MDEPLFKSAYDAAVFATNFNHQVVPRSSMCQKAAPSTGSGSKGLGGLDGAGQAGLILRAMHELPGGMWGAICYVRVAPRAKPCYCSRPCCTGYTPNLEWAEEVGVLVSLLRQYQEDAREPGKRGSVDHPRLRQALVHKYFGEKLALKQLAEEHEVADMTVSAQHKYVFRTLRAQEAQAWNALDTKLRQLNVIGESNYE